MNGKLIAGGVLVLLIVVGGIFLLIGSASDAGSGTLAPVCGSPGPAGSVAAPCVEVPAPAH